MEHLRWWLLLLAAVMLSMSGCARAPDWGAWRAHPAQFASGQHLLFSVRNGGAWARGPDVRVTERDIALASDQEWWGEQISTAPPADLSGRWVGTWKGRGLFDSPRQAPVEARLIQQGRIGVAHLRLEDTIAAGVPWLVRYAGSRGVRLVYRVSGYDAWMRHPGAGRELTAVFTLVDRWLIGTLPGADTPVVVTLTRRPE